MLSRIIRRGLTGRHFIDESLCKVKFRTQDFMESKWIWSTGYFFQNIWSVQSYHLACRGRGRPASDWVLRTPAVSYICSSDTVLSYIISSVNKYIRKNSLHLRRNNVKEVRNALYLGFDEMQLMPWAKEREYSYRKAGNYIAMELLFEGGKQMLETKACAMDLKAE